MRALEIRVLVAVFVSSGLVCCKREEPADGPNGIIDYSEVESNVGNFSVTLLKSKDGPVFIQIRNNGLPSALVLRHGDLVNELTFERQALNGTFEPIPRKSPKGTEIDYRELTDTDWCLLNRGDGLSWLLALDKTENLAVGDRVRITWRPPRETPPKLFAWGKPFPNIERMAVTMVAPLGDSLEKRTP